MPHFEHVRAPRESRCQSLWAKEQPSLDKLVVLRWLLLPPWQALQRPHAALCGSYALYAIEALIKFTELSAEAFFRNA